MISEHKNVLTVFVAVFLATAFILNVLWATGILMWGGYINGPEGFLELYIPVIFGTNYGPILISLVAGALASGIYKAYSHYKG